MKVCFLSNKFNKTYFSIFKEGRRRLFIDSPKQDTTNSISEKQLPITPRKAGGVIKQLFASPTSSSSSNTSLIINDKRQKLF